MDLHRLAEERSIAYHSAVADRLRAEPGLVEIARARAGEWIQQGRSAHHAVRWRVLLDGPFPVLLEFLVDRGERARALRQSTPFAGFIDARQRWQIWRDVRAGFEHQAEALVR